MGKKRFQKKHQNRSKSSGNRRNGYTEADKTNDKFWTYYKAQNLIVDEEWEEFQKALQTDLPASFRVQGCHKDRDQLVKEMEDRFFTKIRATDDASVFVPQELSWYPTAYQTKMSRTEVRSHPILAQFHNFLVTEAELGNISRQEAVSMIPPLLLRPHKDHFVLDMCAAPGSKTMQLIEMMHDEDPNPSGMIVANDVDKSRCYMLIHQILKRMKNASTVALCEDATALPEMYLKEDEPLRFDRVLCDVICSGDGTLRKNPDIWDKWSPQEGLGLHRLQLSIARRGCELLKEGGQLVYSTCSMNPIEDEAVVAQLLREAKGSLRLVDAHPIIPKLKSLRGVNTWKVYDRDMKEYNSPADATDPKMQKAIQQSLFPPTEEEAKEYNLHYTMRVAPHLQDTGGFFVALLEKVGPIEFERKIVSSGATWRQQKMFKDDPFTFLKVDDERWFDIRDHYGIGEHFPYTNLFNRMNENENSRQLFYANDAVKSFVLNNMKKVSIQNAGMRMFGRNENKIEQVRFRVSQEGVKLLFPFLTKQKVKIDKEDMLTMLKHETNLTPMEDLKAKDLLREQMSGSCIVYVDEDEPVCCWIGHRTCAPYVSKEEKIHLLRMLGEDTEAIEVLMKNKRREKANKDRDAAEAYKRELNGDRKKGSQRGKQQNGSNGNTVSEATADQDVVKAEVVTTEETGRTDENPEPAKKAKLEEEGEVKAETTKQEVEGETVTSTTA